MRSWVMRSRSRRSPRTLCRKRSYGADLEPSPVVEQHGRPVEVEALGQEPRDSVEKLVSSRIRQKWLLTSFRAASWRLAYSTRSRSLPPAGTAMLESRVDGEFEIGGLHRLGENGVGAEPNQLARGRRVRGLRRDNEDRSVRACNADLRERCELGGSESLYIPDDDVRR
ncbi:MAG TPA: hypothetical protein VLK65_12275 [Vicinamibacteria bacterium]|nr:hypothetical protein [Vicinamibacteria bacterium]